MAADPSKDRLSEEIETDLRLLSAETRRSEGFTSWLTGPDFPQIKEAAERGVLKLRGVTGRSSESVDAVQKSKEVLKPFQLACHSKNTKLASIALVSFQKLLAKEAVSDEGIEIMISGLEQVEEMHDEGVQLKLLQTVLAMLQSSIHAHLEDCSKRILGIGFRLLGYSRNSDSVVSTASATVRQGVALVFDHISLTPEQMQREEGARPSLQGPESPRDGPEGFESGSAYAALKLLDDLCLMAGGSPSTWLRTASPPRTFVLELLDFVVVDNVAVFRSSPVFEHALLSRVCHLLLGQLHDLLDPTLEGQGGHGGHGHFALLRIVLKTTRTVLRQFYTLLGAKCGAFIEVLLSGTASNCALWQRVGAAQTLRQVCGEAGLVHHLFVTYDMRWEVKLAVVQKTMQTCSDVIFSATSAPSLDGQQEADPEATAAIAACHLAAAEGTGKQMVTGGEVAHMTPDEGTAYVAMLAIECIAAIVSSVETLTVAVTTFPLATADKGKELTEGEAGSANGAVDEATCKEMVDRLAAVLKQTLSRLIASASPGTLLNALFGCYQQFVEACGLLGVPELRDSFLKNLNTFTFTFPDAAAPVALPNDGAARLQQPSGGPPPAQQQRLFLSGTEHATLDAKNLVALRTLYAIATRLALQLGDSWMLVLGTVNCVDCILATPRQAAQEGSAHGHNAQLAPSDLAEVSAGASALFQRTADMSDEAVVTLLGALHAVSAASLSTAVLHGGHTKLFALERMVQVLHVNMHRIYDLWGIFLSHVLEVLASSKAGLRTAAMDAIGKAIIGALSRRAPAGCTEDADGGVENMLLVALTSLYTDEREADVQLGVLRVTINVLERHGERLTQGWVPLLRLLAAVPQRGGADAIKLGFRSLELLCSDYLSSLTVEQLRRCLEVAAMYANQQADLNVSLTAISQLWNAADFLARLPTLDSDAPTGTPGVVPPAAMMASSGPPSTGSLRAAGVDSSKYAELLEVLFGALQALADELARRLGRERCWRVRWPGSAPAADPPPAPPSSDGVLEGSSVPADASQFRKDANDVLMADGPDYLRDCIEAAEPYPIRGLFRFSDFHQDILEYYGMQKSADLAVTTGWASLDEYYKVIPGELTIITGVPNSGKSEWIDALLVNLTTLHGWSFALCSMEKKVSVHARQLLEKQYGMPFLLSDNSGPAARMTEQQVHQGLEWLDDCFHLIRCEDDELPSVDWVLNLARAAVLRFGIRGLVIDPYNELDHQRPSHMSETEYVSQMLTKIKRFAQHHDVHVWFVAHPRQMQNWKGDPPNLYDISGSAHFINKCDNGIVVHRNNDPAKGPPSEVNILIRKVRNKMAGGIGDVFLSYDKRTGRYVDAKYQK